MRRNITRAADGVVEYHATRLLFIRDVVESLAQRGAFRIITRDDGTFQFTREQFERVFSGITKTRSWREGGVYHFPDVPQRATPFQVQKKRLDEG